jgi:hypothetical protein
MPGDTPYRILWARALARPRNLLRRSRSRATLPSVSESAYKPTDVYEDELDQLAHSIRNELRQIGFAPAFDPLPEELARIRNAERALRKRREMARRMLMSYIAPALVVVAVGLALRLFVPGF